MSKSVTRTKERRATRARLAKTEDHAAQVKRGYGGDVAVSTLQLQENSYGEYDGAA